MNAPVKQTRRPMYLEMLQLHTLQHQQDLRRIRTHLIAGTPEAKALDELIKANQMYLEELRFTQHVGGIEIDMIHSEKV